MDDELEKLPNIGKDTARQLRLVGIESVEQLKQIGSKEAWLKLKAMDPSACIQRLQGLEGALQGINKRQLSMEVKQDLKDFYNFHK